jgi:hypothetical protein
MTQLDGSWGRGHPRILLAVGVRHHEAGVGDGATGTVLHHDWPRRRRELGPTAGTLGSEWRLLDPRDVVAELDIIHDPRLERPEVVILVQTARPVRRTIDQRSAVDDPMREPAGPVVATFDQASCSAI